MNGAGVIELHGNATRTRCLECGIAYTRDELHAWTEACELPACPACVGIVKPTTVLFGEAMAAVLEEVGAPLLRTPQPIP